KYTQTEVGIHRDIYKFIQNNTTLRYSFHSQNQSNTLLMLHESTGNIAAFMAARELVDEWMIYHYKQKTDDMKYCWYDHGTAERLMTFVRLFVLSAEMEADMRFMAKLITVIFEHAQLLSSEVFYARDQNYRYHNHGLFQDIALLSTSLILDIFELSEDWKKIAIERMVDQFDHLIYQEGKFAVLMENSPGYHAGTVRMVAFIVGMLEAADDQKNFKFFNELYEKMNNFTNVIRYPGGRIPSIGDTFRMANSQELAERSRKSSQEIGFHAIDKAGYVIVNGQDNGVDFKFILTATNLNKTHKHDDHLSFILFFDGIEWLTDPSFYSHQYTDPIPAYLRSAAAHNVMYLEDREFSNEIGIAHLESKLNKNEFEINGYHEAYKNVKIIREVQGSLDKLSLSFKDKLESSSQVNPIVFFHCAETIVPEKVEEGILLTSELSDKKILIKLPKEVDMKINYGLEEPYRSGWIGSGFSDATKSYTIECTLKGSELESKISISK
ncbi:MAG: heparinase II/III family protein, partial [Campylobacterales bacterium]|nr:heparinase II/III family protein [Campylobacterales bacterium]